MGLRTEALFVGLANIQRKREALSNEKKERIVKLLMAKDIAVFAILGGARQVADPAVRLHRESSGRHWSWNASAAINARLTRPPSRPPTPKAVRAGGRVLRVPLFEDAMFGCAAHCRWSISHKQGRVNSRER